MPAAASSVIVVGAGIFGVTSALELARRGHSVTLIDRGPGLHPRAASSDTTKLIRPDYGLDALYTSLLESAVEGWRRWNREWRTTVFHEVGALTLSEQTLKEGDFEHDILRQLESRAHVVERLDRKVLAERFPAWNQAFFAEGYHYPQGGWAESARAVKRLLVEARAAGVRIRHGWAVSRLLERESRVSGVEGRDGQRLTGDVVVLATGTWTPLLLPELADRMWSTGFPLMYFRPRQPERFQPPQFPPWVADLLDARWYGFPADRDGLLKVVNFGLGRRLHPDDPRAPEPHVESVYRQFLRKALPSVAGAPLAGSHLQLDCDTFDHGFWIARHPNRLGLVVAAGGSGHAFKFAPVLGGIIADVVEEKPGDSAERFAWRVQPGMDTGSGSVESV